MNTAEIDISLNEITQYLGSEVENVFYAKETLILQIRPSQGDEEGVLKPAYLVFSAKTTLSLIVLLKEMPFKIKSEIKPLYLFAKKHLTHTTLLEAQRDESLGRVVRLEFLSSDGESNIELEQFLIPTHWNIAVKAKGKFVFLNAPKDLPSFQSIPIFDKVDDEKNALDKYKNKVFDFFQEKVKTQKAKVPLLAIEISKKEKLLKKLKQELNDKKEQGYKVFAELLGVDPKKAQKQFPEYFDSKKNIYQLQKEYFEKYKKNKSKIQRVLEREKELYKELKYLTSITPEDWEKQHQGQSILSAPKKKSKPTIQARKLELTPDCVAYIGKSAKDNVMLLRQAKSWHYWLHIKDEPSAYVIVHSPKNKKLDFSEVQAIGKWFVAASNKLSKNVKSGDKITFLVTQCRYVRAIKGDKLGRVSYTHEQVYTISV